MIRLSYSLLFVPALLLHTACGSEAPSSGSPSSAPATSVALASAPLLKADVPDAKNVLEVLALPVGTEVAVVGRVSKTLKGRALLYLTDESIDYCGRGESTDDGCPTPWDYCCKEDEFRKGTIMIEVLGADGKTLAVSSVGVRELDLVAARGTLRAGPGGLAFVEVKDGWFRRDRPKLPDSVKFPE